MKLTDRISFRFAPASLPVVFALALATALAQGPVRRTARQNTPVLMASTGAGPIGAVATTALFAQVAIGGGYTTVFTFMNTGTTAVSGKLILTDSEGRPFNASLSEPSPFPEAPSLDRPAAVGSSADVAINPGGTQFIAAGPASPGDPTAKNGWARVESEGGSLGGVATFQYTEGGTLKTIAGVLASDTFEFATIPVDNDDSQSRYTGFAVANTGSESINVKLATVNEQGTQIDSLSPGLLNPIAPGKQVAVFLHQLAANRVTFKGSMVLIAQGGKKFAVVALVLNQGLLTAIPVIPAKAPGIN